MKNITKFLTMVVGILISINGYGQKDTTVTTVPFQLGFFPPLSTNGVNNIHSVNKLSINIFAGLAYGLDGFEAAGFANLERGFVSGVQLAGFANLVGGPVDGAQFAGFMNTVNDDVTGVQASGFLNAVNGNVSGVQAAGFLNTSRHATDVAQLAGFANASLSVDGLQASGFGNYALDVKGIQGAGFMNVARDVNGAQIGGFMNVARTVHGTQLAGFINICDSIDGVPIAFLNIVRKNGYRSFEVSANELFYLNGAFKIGVEAFYTILGAGVSPQLNAYTFATTIGFGTQLRLSPESMLNIEALAYNPIRKSKWFYEGNTQFYSLRTSFAYEVAPHFKLFAGPSFTLMVADPDEPYGELVPAWNGTVFNNRYSDVAFWPGFQAGFRF